MKIGFDYVNTVGVGGLSTYSRNLIDNLAIIDQENSYYLCHYWHDFLPGRKRQIFTNYHFKLVPTYFSPLGINIPEKIVNLINRAFIRMTNTMRRLDVFHFTNPLNYVLGINNGVVTIHDLALLHNEDWAKKKNLRNFTENIGKIIAEAKMVIAVSEFTKNDIMNSFVVDEKKIRVIYEAATAEFYPDRDRECLMNIYGLGNYILYAGQLQPRKNIFRLLEAYSRLQANLTDIYQLVLVGKPQSQIFLSDVHDAISRFGITGKVKILGYVENDILRKVYSCAKFFVYPSLFEGFGLPILEAYNCGTPVVTSRSSALPEVAGEKAAILIDPMNISELKSAMEKLLTNDDFYQMLKNNTLDEAKKFNWRKTAKETKAVYNEVVNEARNQSRSQLNKKV